MNQLKGKLSYMGWERPWMLIHDEFGGPTIDLMPIICEVFSGIHGQPVSQMTTKDSYELKINPSSEYKLDFDVSKPYALFLDKIVGFGFTNVQAYFEMLMMWMNGRSIILEWQEDGFKMFANPAEDVPGVYFTRNNSCAVSEEMAKETCQPGTEDCCIFLTAGAGGFECSKFDTSTSRYILNRAAEGTMRAKRIGNCHLLGRREDEIEIDA